MIESLQVRAVVRKTNKLRFAYSMARFRYFWPKNTWPTALWLTQLWSCHLADRYLADRHLANRHLADRHLANRHLANRHLANRHLADRHLADMWSMKLWLWSTQQSMGWQVSCRRNVSRPNVFRPKEVAPMAITGRNLNPNVKHWEWVDNVGLVQTFFSTFSQS